MADNSSDGWGALLVLGLILYSCSGSEPSADYEDDASYSDSFYAEREEFDEDAAREAAEEELASESYDSIGSPYGCTIDCSGHEAGYAWAAEGNEDYGVSNSQSFDEGQQAYEDAVEDRVDEMRDEYDSGEEAY